MHTTKEIEVMNHDFGSSPVTFWLREITLHLSVNTAAIEANEVRNQKFLEMREVEHALILQNQQSQIELAEMQKRENASWSALTTGIYGIANAVESAKQKVDELVRNEVVPDEATTELSDRG